MNQVSAMKINVKNMLGEKLGEKLGDDWVKVGWKNINIGEIIDFVGGGTPDKKKSEYWNGNIKWASVKDVKNKYLHETQDRITELGLKNSSSQLAREGELILVTRISPGKCVIAKDDIAINQDLKIVRLKSDVSTNFLYYFFTATENEFIKRSSGTTVKGIRLEEIRNVKLNLPPLPEQRAIVSKIELLFSELDNGIANLKLAQEQLKVYRQAVLKKAFEGELTKEWRKSNENQDINKFIYEIDEKRADYFLQKGKKVKKVKPVSEEEISEQSPLPLNWKHVRLNDLSFLITDGKHGDCKNQDASGYFFISAKDIFDGKINYKNARQITKDDFEEVHKRTDLQPEDVLVTNAGTIGRIAIATANDKTSKTTFQKSVAIIKKPNLLVDSKYLAYHLENDVERIKMVSKGTAQKNLLLGTMSELIISICPFKEQKQVVTEIETRLSVCDKVEQDIAENLEKAEALRQSILKKAFEGKLLSERELEEVRLAEDWEPAEVLLKRVKAERAESGKR